MALLLPPPLTLLDRYYGPQFHGLYSTTVRVIGGEARHGRASGIARSDDGYLAADLRLPHALGGPGGGTNPEQLFAASYAACFHGALSLIAAKNDISICGAVVDVSVTFGRDPVDGMYMLAADIKIQLPGIDQALAEELVRNAERVCPYAKMARQGIASTVALSRDG
ncbi:Ohr family peroxiredoxin [Caballeronia sp. dw_276]|uniref:Ohr family peroxiredoxin n=1 Tax=Caballeronia sp. dw_276 TaxID=2719795 RepID=UPI001BD5247B|nr:Ohr family peroxiredoxin [Caballeronia sp. dw_276]